MDMQSAAVKFSAGLIEEIDSINDEVKLGNDSFLLKVGGEEVDIIKRERRLSAPLGVPDDAFANPGLDLIFNCLSREYLRVSHDMLFNSGFGFNIGESEAKQKGESTA